MAIIKEKFGRYHVELETDYGDEGRTDCRIRWGAYTAGLQVALDTSELETPTGASVKIESAIVDDIESWAMEHGY